MLANRKTTGKIDKREVNESEMFCSPVETTEYKIWGRLRHPTTITTTPKPYLLFPMSEQFHHFEVAFSLYPPD